jgi:hypothetical protein
MMVSKGEVVRGRGGGLLWLMLLQARMCTWRMRLLDLRRLGERVSDLCRSGFLYYTFDE